jgi:Tol biopolymer transport system component
VHDAKGDRRVTSDAFAFNPVFSPDETKLYYLVKTSLGATVPYGTLWVIDLASGQRLRLLPDFQMEHFALADDGNRVALVAANERNYLGVWVATLDGSAAPRQLTAHRGLQAFFDARGNLFFDAEDPDGTFVYRARSDGSAPQRVIADPVRILHGVSPDGNHAAVWMTRSIGGSSNAVGIYPLDGGAPSVVCRSCGYRSGGGAGPPEVTWSRDGTTLYLALIGGASVFAIPLRPGAPVPAFPPDGLGSIEEAAALPGAKPMPVAGAVAGSTMSVYAYEKQSAQRNIYRVSIRD